MPRSPWTTGCPEGVTTPARRFRRLRAAALNSTVAARQVGGAEKAAPTGYRNLERLLEGDPSQPWPAPYRGGMTVPARGFPLTPDVRRFTLCRAVTMAW